MNKIEALTKAGNLLLRGEVCQAKETVKSEYPFQNLNARDLRRIKKKVG